MTEVKELSRIHGRLRECRRCPGVCGEPVHGPVLSTPIMLVGQAPGKAAKGDRAPSAAEIANCRPFLRGEVLALRPQTELGKMKLALGLELFRRRFHASWSDGPGRPG